MATKDKLWVFDTQCFLEIYAPTLEDAENQVIEIEKASGVEYTLVHNWENYQREHAEGGSFWETYQRDAGETA